MTIDPRRYFGVGSASEVSAVVLTLDSGLANAGGESAKLLDTSRIAAHRHFPPQEGGHAARCASLVAGSFFGSGPSGIAHGATVVHCDYRHLFPHAVVDVARQVSQRVGPIDVIAMPFSAEHRSSYRKEHGEQLARLVNDPDIGALCLAAAGHDGPERLRFPATITSFMAIGVCRPDLTVHPSSGTSSRLHKPDLVVPDGAYDTETDGGEPSTMSGTSAAVAIAAGGAALLAQFMRSLGKSPTPAALRALLLALTIRTPAGQNALAERAFDLPERRLTLIESEAAIASGENLVLHVTAERRGRLALAFAKPPEFGLWTGAAPTVEVRRTSPGEGAERIGAADHLMEIEGECSIEIRNLGVDTRLAIAATGLRRTELTRSAHRPRTSYYLGVSASHNAAACVIDDRSILSAIQLERLSRRKNDGSAVLAVDDHIRYALADSGLSPADIKAGINVQALTPGYVGLSQPLKTSSFSIVDPVSAESTYLSHHLAHAISVFACSGFESATVLVADGSGGTVVGGDDLLISGRELASYLTRDRAVREPLHVASIYHFTRTGFRLCHRLTSPSFNTRAGSASWGETYAAVSQFLFGDWMQGSGKLMGLAGFGDPERFGPSLLNRSATHGFLEFGSDWKLPLGTGNPSPAEDIMRYADLAARIQKDLEAALLDWAMQAVALTGCERIAYSGGIALNSIANDLIATSIGEENFFVLPASNDAGIAIGAAAAACFRETGHFPTLAFDSDYLGHAYGEADFDEAIDQFAPYIHITDYDAEEVALALSEGQVIAWFDGGAEFGQRALGHRSILASPFLPWMQDHLNREIKFREGFRPFAPIVIEESCEHYFEAARRSPFMMRVLRVREDMRRIFPAMCHVDGTARAQTLNKQVNPRLYALLKWFEARAGHPILINTSLNVKGQPIVETPLEAIELLLSSKIDLLVLGNRCVRPVLATDEDLTSRLKLVLAPDVSVTVESGSGRPAHAVVEAGARAQRYSIDVEMASALQRLDGERPLSDVERDLGIREPLAQSPVFRALYVERFFLTRKPEKSLPEAFAAPAPQESPDPRDVLLSGTFRTADPAALLPKALRKVRTLGVTRISDITHFDRIGIPVFQAWRPDVESSQITATQGKGITADEARLSALLEAVERHAANKIQSLIADHELPKLRNGAAVFTPAQLGASHNGVSVANWYEVRNVRSEASVFVPAAAIFFPFHLSGEGKASPNPCTTGLAAGSTFEEAVLHGLFEVVERHSVSVVELQGRSKWVELRVVEEIEPELTRRMRDANYELMVTDCTAIDGLPVYFVRLLSRRSDPPHLISCGQGCSLSGRHALRRAMLEACQSRLVALLGAREDLARHAPHWAQEHQQAKEIWDGAARCASRNGRTAEISAVDFETVSGALGHALALLERADFHDVLAADLTVPAVGIPVARCIIPRTRDVISGR